MEIGDSEYYRYAVMHVWLAARESRGQGPGVWCQKNRFSYHGLELGKYDLELADVVGTV
jgi:hypothetical protein